MGFSVSATYALIFFGLLFAMGTLHAAASNTAEDVTAAQQYQNDHLATIQETKLNVTSVAVADATNCDVTVAANNTGDTRLAVGETDVLADGGYETDAVGTTTVDGDGDTDLWLPGQQLEMEVETIDAAPRRVKVVSGPGVADTMEVSGLSC